MKHFSSIKGVARPKAQSAAKNSLLSALSEATSYGLTENAALTHVATGAYCLDFFAQAGAMRADPGAALGLFQKAFAEDRQLACRILCYLRDVRGGQGERQLFRRCLQWLGEYEGNVFCTLLQHVPEYGRWDDIFFESPAVYDMIFDQLRQDQESAHPSLLAKWLPTLNASSAHTRAKAMEMASGLCMHPYAYRKLVRDLRRKIRVVEQQMSARQWDQINYSHVPSQAGRIYRKAFARHDETRYAAFIEAAKEGKAKINSGTLYPYQIYKSVESDYSPALDALWAQLPDYTQGRNALVVADVSGSMDGDPKAVSVSLALYFAERNQGAFKDHFITFSAVPQLQRVVGATLSERMSCIDDSHWDMNTNVAAVFAMLLVTAAANKVPASEMPSTIYIISDMQFDAACADNESTNFEIIDAAYKEAGYVRPTLVFWNVNASGKNVPVRQDEPNVTLISGFSPTAFKIAVENKTPYQVMLETVNSVRYERIII